jgi:lysophospholipase L1-like esterase
MDRGRLVLAGSSLALCAFVLEGGFRVLEPRLGVDAERIRLFREFVGSGGRVAEYESRAHTLYTRPRGQPGINSLGFADEEVPAERTPGVVRIACLGSSTTEGGNDRRDGAYPHLLRQVLSERTGRPFEVLNFGMSGWTTAETMVNYFLVVQDYAPDLVILHEAANDVEPRARPYFRADYSHYRRSWTPPCYSLPYRLLVGASDLFAWTQLRGASPFNLDAVVVAPPPSEVPAHLDPATAAAFRRNVLTIAEHVRLRGGRAVLATVPYDTAAAERFPIYRAGIDEHNDVLRALARDHGFVLVDLDRAAREGASTGAPFFLDLVHMSPEGNRFKAEVIAEALVRGGHLPP